MRPGNDPALVRSNGSVQRDLIYSPHNPKAEAKEVDFL